MRNTPTAICLLVFFLSTGSPFVFADSGVVILDDFENDTIGASPGNADIGEVYYYGLNHHSVVSDLDGQCVESFDDVIDGGYAVQYMPVSAPTVFEATYVFKLISGSSGTDPVAYQQLTGQTDTGNEIYNLYWRGDSSISFLGTSPTFTWNYNTSYHVRFRLDCENDIAGLWIDGDEIVDDLALTTGCTDLFDFSWGSLYVTENLQRIDEIKVVDDTPIFEDGFESGNTFAW
jgi:hypothetical protein